MSFYSEASLVMIPSGVKEGKVYSAKPVDGTGDLTFSRGSDIEATRIGADGLIHKAQVNLLLQSNSFDTTWISTNSTETGGQSGYDGTNDAWLLEVTGASGRIGQSYSASGVFSLSLYAKAGSVDWLRLRIVASVDANAWFNLNTGSVGFTDGNIDATITSAGGGWYRISLTANLSSISDIRFYPATGDAVNGATGDNVYIQDAQLNYGLVAQTYQETTTAAVVSGITDNMPRLSYDPANPTCPHLILEPSRQNLVPHSDYIGSLVAEKGTLTSNADTSPEGVLNATSFVEDSTTGRHRSSFFVSVTSGQTYTFSMFAKIKSGTRLLCINNAATIGARAYFNLVSGAVEGVDSGTASIEDYGNGWFRCSITAQSSITGTATTYFGLEDGTADNGYTGDGTSGHYWYGLQLEAGSYSSSLIPTYGSSATRTAENSTQALAAGIFTSTEGAWFFQVKDMKFDITGTGVGSMNLTFNNSINTSIEVIQDGNEFFKITLDGSTAIQDLDGEKKVAITWGSFGLKIYVDGAQAYTTVNTTYSRQYTHFDLSRITREWSGLMKQLIFFPSALSDTELATLTTL